MQRSTLTLGLGVAAVAAIALAPRLQGLLAVPTGPIPMVLTAKPVEQSAVVEPEALIGEVQSQLEPAPLPPPVPEPLPMHTTRDGPIAEVHEPRPAPATVVHGDGVIPMKTGSNGHIDDLPELDEQAVQQWWDDCPACGMG